MTDLSKEQSLTIKDDLQNKQLEKFKEMSSFDWKQLPPPVVASILIQKPFKGRAGEPDIYLRPWQAIMFATRCFELGLSPFSNECWFNTQNNSTNITFEGKLKLARLQGLKLGPPQMSEVKREWSPTATKLFGLPEEPGIRCAITVNGGEKAEYTAWLSEWFVGTSPVWKAKWSHMLQLRAAEKCLSFASGTGASELPGDQDLAVDKQATEFLSNAIEVK